MHATLPLLRQTDFPAIARGTVETLQVNVGYRCNQSCVHCHVNAGPTRKEAMDAADKVQELADAAKTVNPDILCLCHGGPIANPADAQYILNNTEGIVGFYGASSIERFPTEVGIRKQTEDFKAVTFKK